MGAWGSSTLENDDAWDWLPKLRANPSWTLIERAFAAILVDEEGYRDADACNIALISAEVVAAALARPHAELPAEIASWLHTVPAMHSGLPAVAREAIDAIRTDSELRDLWAETDSLDDWLQELAALYQRCADPGPR